MNVLRAKYSIFITTLVAVAEVLLTGRQNVPICTDGSRGRRDKGL